METETRENVRQMICSLSLGICVCPSATIRGKFLEIDVCLRRGSYGDECMFDIQCSRMHPLLRCRWNENDDPNDKHNVSTCACKVPLLWDSKDRMCFDSKEAEYNLIMTIILGITALMVMLSIITRKFFRDRKKSCKKNKFLNF